MSDTTTEPPIDETIRRHAEVLWDYHDVSTPRPDRVDFILALGSHDLRVAARAAELLLEGTAPLLVVSGGAGKVTGGEWAVPEAERFAELARTRGVPDTQILVEPNAKNTGDNVTLARKLLQERGIDVTTGLLVAKPYMKRRALATAMKQWPEVTWYAEGPLIKFKGYATADTPERRMIDLMVGDLQRIAIYPSQGLQVPMPIPPAVHGAYEALVNAGFDKYLI
jgi:uncharacterized SAM-binding protein YcdF (DUF218 family)